MNYRKRLADGIINPVTTCERTLLSDTFTEDTHFYSNNIIDIHCGTYSQAPTARGLIVNYSQDVSYGVYRLYMYHYSENILWKILIILEYMDLIERC